MPNPIRKTTIVEEKIQTLNCPYCGLNYSNVKQQCGVYINLVYTVYQCANNHLWTDDIDRATFLADLELSRKEPTVP
jgi:hypothetical protein